MSPRHCICAVLVTWLTGSAVSPRAQQQAAAPAAGTTSSFMIFLRGNPMGVEQMALTRTTEGWSILSTGRLAQPFHGVVRKIEARYTADWKPLGYNIDTTVRGQFQRVITTIEGTTATTEITTGTETTRKS